MENFVLYNPTKIIFGRGTIPTIGSESKLLGSKALLVYGRESIKHNGIYQTVVAALNEHGVEFFEHGGVRSNPVLSHVREGIAKAKTHKVELIIAVGGGSVLDTAKAICAGAVVEHDVWKFFTGKKGIKKCLPLATVLTLAAAGSEMNSAWSSPMKRPRRNLVSVIDCSIRLSLFWIPKPLILCPQIIPPMVRWMPLLMYLSFI